MANPPGVDPPENGAQISVPYAVAYNYMKHGIADYMHITTLDPWDEESPVYFNDATFPNNAPLVTTTFGPETFAVVGNLWELENSTHFYECVNGPLASCRRCSCLSRSEAETATHLVKIDYKYRPNWKTTKESLTSMYDGDTTSRGYVLQLEVIGTRDELLQIWRPELADIVLDYCHGIVSITS